MDIDFDVEINLDTDLVDLVNRVTARAIELTATDVWAGIRKNAPVDHGRLAGSFQMRKNDDLSQVIFTNVHYALYVHEGTGIYGKYGTPIVPRTARALSFFWKVTGSRMTLASVDGMKGRPYTDKPLADTEKRLDEFVRRAINETK